MDKMINIIEKLAQKAQNEVLPQIYVSDEVMTRISLMRRSGQGILPFEIFAGATAIAASIVLFISIQSLHSIFNPMYQLLAPNQGNSIW